MPYCRHRAPGSCHQPHSCKPITASRSTAVGLLPTAGGSRYKGATDTTDAAAQASSSLPAAAVVADAITVVDPQSHLPQQLQQQPQVHSQTSSHTQPASTIKPKNLKPIRGSSAFSMGQPKRPALAQRPPQAQPLHFMATPSPAPAVLTRPAVSQAAALSHQAPLVSDVQASLVSATNTEAQTGAVLGLVTAAPSTSGLPSTTAAGQLPMAEHQNPSAMVHAVAAQPRAIPQIRAATGGLFGAAPQPRAAALGSQGISTASGLAGSSPMEPDLAAVSRLRAQLTLPFALAPAEGQPAISKAGKRQQPEGQNSLGEASAVDGKGKEGSAAEGIRAVVAALQAEEPCHDADAVQPPGKKQKKGRTASFSVLKSCWGLD
ncbi:hypothetical protein ABBQ38_002693 [Trebouxia sp. C0009 RCD-2024]